MYDSQSRLVRMEQIGARFAPLRTIANAPDVLKARILAKFELEPVLLTNICLDSNGFAGCKPVCNDQGDLTSYSKSVQYAFVD